MTYGYDQLDRLRSTSAPNRSTAITAQYNALGWRSLTDATGTTAFTYDKQTRHTLLVWRVRLGLSRYCWV